MSGQQTVLPWGTRSPGPVLKASIACVARLKADGLRTWEISARTGFSANTVRKYVMAARRLGDSDSEGGA